MLQQTTALRKISALKKKYRVIRGGQGAAKTISILIILINHASNNPNREILVLSAELSKMRRTVIKDLQRGEINGFNGLKKEFYTCRNWQYANQLLTTDL